MCIFWLIFFGYVLVYLVPSDVVTLLIMFIVKSPDWNEGFIILKAATIFRKL
jgi:hypothetical protein